MALVGIELETLVSEPIFQIVLLQLSVWWPDFRAMNVP